MKKHRAPLEKYEISSGAINKIPNILASYKKIYAVCDANTYKVAGEQVENVLKASNMHYKH